MRIQELEERLISINSKLGGLTNLSEALSKAGSGDMSQFIVLVNKLEQKLGDLSAHTHKRCSKLQEEIDNLGKVEVKGNSNDLRDIVNDLKYKLHNLTLKFDSRPAERVVTAESKTSEKDVYVASNDFEQRMQDLIANLRLEMSTKMEKAEFDLSEINNAILRIDNLSQRNSRQNEKNEREIDWIKEELDKKASKELTHNINERLSG